MVPIIAHNEILPLGYRDRADFRDVILMRGVPFIRGEVSVLVIKGLSIDKDFVPQDFNFVSRESDDPFYEVFARVNRVDKDDHVIPFGFTDRNDRFSSKRYFDPVDEFVDQNMVSDQQGGLHGTGGYLECLDDKGPDDQGKQNRNGGRFGIFSENAFLFDRFFFSFVHQ